MKNTIIFFAYLALMALVAQSGLAEVDQKDKISIVVGSMLEVKADRPTVSIEVVESRFAERERARKEAEISEIAKRQLLARERSSTATKSPNSSASVNPVHYNLDELRVLYREAGSKFSVDWRLIEAVHQVESGKSTDTCKKSYAGATGPMQFMPGTFRAYQNEGNNICGLRDSVFAAAHLLARGGADRGDIDSALFNYNHSWSYVEKVKSVMNSI